MVLPFLIFWAVVFLARGELGWRGVLICVGIWTFLLLGFLYLQVPPPLFVAAQAVLDCVLVLIVFRSDIRVR